MVSNPKLDLGLARIAHLNWEFEMESISRGVSKSSGVQSYQDCELGRWLHGQGIKTYSKVEGTHPLVGAHRDFHEAAKRLVQVCQCEGDSSNIDKELQIVRRLSRDIIFHLTEMELDSLEYRQEKSIPKRPTRSLFQRIFSGPFSALPKDHGTLEVSQARLIHLRWSRNLTNAFRHWGKDTNLESADMCALGVWIHATGLQQYRNLPEITQLDEAHKAFHDHASTTLRALRHKQLKRAEENYGKTLDFSRKVIYLLSVIEFKLLDSDNIQRTKSFLSND
ncbi:MAG: CZB domain-containing protein [Magnetococcales bacterium]|nr:CZB domain-containing protein [Magnetococcales bacterium]